MFSLIVVLVSILLVGALAAAAMYYGGSAATDGRKQAEAVALINQGMQVKAAVEMHKVTEHTGVNSLQELVDKNYLSAIPTSAWGTSTGYAIASVDNRDNCLAANEKLGVPGIPHCDDPRIASKTICCTTVEAEVVTH